MYWALLKIVKVQPTLAKEAVMKLPKTSSGVMVTALQKMMLYIQMQRQSVAGVELNAH